MSIPSIVIPPPVTVCRRMFSANQSSGTNATAYPFSVSMNFGIGYRKRDILVGVISGSVASNPVTGVNVAGTGATLLVAGQLNTGGFAEASWWIARNVVPTTGVCNISFAGEASRCGVTVYSVYNLESATPVGTHGNGPVGVTSDSGDLAVSKGGIVLAAWYSGSASPDVTWSGVDQDLKTAVETSRLYSSASKEITEDDPSYTVGLTHPVAINGAWAAVSLR